MEMFIIPVFMLLSNEPAPITEKLDVVGFAFGSEEEPFPEMIRIFPAMEYVPENLRLLPFITRTASNVLLSFNDNDVIITLLFSFIDPCQDETTLLLLLLFKSGLLEGWVHEKSNANNKIYKLLYNFLTLNLLLP